MAPGRRVCDILDGMGGKAKNIGKIDMNNGMRGIQKEPEGLYSFKCFPCGCIHCKEERLKRKGGANGS